MKCLLLFVALAGLFVADCVSANDARPFAVTDSIAVRRLVSASIHPDDESSPPMFRFSPDGTKFTVVLRRGSIETGLNEYSLMLLDSAEVLSAVNSSDPKPLGRQLLVDKFSIETDDDAIDEVTWLGNASLAFIGRSAAGIGQVYIYTTKTQRLKKLTQHPENITSYDLSIDGDYLLYTAFSVPDWNERDALGYVVQSNDPDSMFHYGTSDPGEMARHYLRYFVLNLKNSALTPLALESYHYPREVAIAPSGRWAVTPASVAKFPAHWERYAFIRTNSMRIAQSYDPRSVSSSVEFNEAFGGPNRRWLQYQLIDLETGKVSPLVDAPTQRRPWHGGGRDRVRASWSPDGRHVLLPPTYLPLDSSVGGELDRRANTEVVVEVEPSTGRVSEIFDIARGTKGRKAAILTALSWTRDGDVIARFSDNDPQNGASERAEQYRRSGDRWIGVSTSASYSATPFGTTNGRLRLSVAQGLTQPPEIKAHDLETRRESVITDLNPQLKNLTLGRVEIFAWKDRLGRSFRGGLVLPPNFQVGQRYPVVVQANDFFPDAYMLDSTSDGYSPHAAQALANRGIIVLQMPDGRRPPVDEDYATATETFLFLAEMESAIDALNLAGLIDPRRVGLIGWSRNGMCVNYALTFTNYPIAAATVADGICLSPRCYTLLYGESYPGAMDSFDSKEIAFGTSGPIGAPFWGSGIDIWRDRSDLFHLDRIRTPIRYEGYGTLVPSYWEYFAILKRHERPVEMLRLPRAQHVLRAPFHVYASKQGNVDWFAFWLNRQEDPDPVKPAQYARWRFLRAQHQHLMGREGVDPTSSSLPYDVSQ